METCDNDINVLLNLLDKFKIPYKTKDKDGIKSIFLSYSDNNPSYFFIYYSQYVSFNFKGDSFDSLIIAE